MFQVIVHIARRENESLESSRMDNPCCVKVVFVFHSDMLGKCSDAED